MITLFNKLLVKLLLGLVVPKFAPQQGDEEDGRLKKRRYMYS